MIYNILFLCFYLSFCISLFLVSPHKPCQDRLSPVNQVIYTSRPSIYNFDILFTVEFRAADCCWSSTLAFSRNSFRKIFPAALSIEVGHQMSEHPDNTLSQLALTFLEWPQSGYSLLAAVCDWPPFQDTVEYLDMFSYHDPITHL